MVTYECVIRNAEEFIVAKPADNPESQQAPNIRWGNENCGAKNSCAARRHRMTIIGRDTSR
jgi:hypothetical protein